MCFRACSFLPTLEFSKSELVSSKQICRKSRKTIPWLEIPGMSILKSIRYTKVQNLCLADVAQNRCESSSRQWRNDRYPHNRIIYRSSRDLSFIRFPTQILDMTMRNTKNGILTPFYRILNWNVDRYFLVAYQRYWLLLLLIFFSIFFSSVVAKSSNRAFEKACLVHGKNMKKKNGAVENKSLWKTSRKHVSFFQPKKNRNKTA